MIDALKQIFNNTLISVITYEISETTTQVIVLEKTDFRQLNHARKNLKNSKHIIMSMADFIDGMDVFPLEFLTMKSFGSTVYGKDVLRDIKIDKKDLRHQLEFELRSKRIHLKNQFVEFGKKALLHRIMPTLLPLINGLLHYKKEDVSDNVQTSLSKIEKVYNIDVAFLIDIIKNDTRTKENYSEYIQKLDTFLKDCITAIN